MTEVSINIETLEAIMPGRSTRLIKIAGELDETNVVEQMEKIYEIMKEVPSNLDIIFDFQELRYLNSKSIGYLTDIYGKLSVNNGKVVIFGARPNVLDTLQVVGLTQLINMFDSLDQAKAGIKNELTPVTVQESAPTIPIAPAPVAEPSAPIAPTAAPVQVDQTPVEPVTTSTPRPQAPAQIDAPATISNPATTQEAQSQTETSAPAQETQTSVSTENTTAKPQAPAQIEPSMPIVSTPVATIETTTSPTPTPEAPVQTAPSTPIVPTPVATLENPTPTPQTPGTIEVTATVEAPTPIATAETPTPVPQTPTSTQENTTNIEVPNSNEEDQNTYKFEK